MEHWYSYIGVAVIVGLLIGLVTLSVIWTVRTVGKSIRDRSISLLSTYDSMLEERSRRLSWLDEAIRKREEELEEAASEDDYKPFPQPVIAAPPTDFLRAAERISTTAYQGDGTGELYRKIRNNFDITPQDALGRTPIEPGQSRRGGPATRLLKELSYDTVYRLSTLPGEEQLQLLRQELPQDAKGLLEQYAEQHSHFDCIAFYDELQSEAAMEPGPVRLHVPPGHTLPLYPGELEIVVDNDICEGVQVEVDNTLYDYCIKTREIG